MLIDLINGTTSFTIVKSIAALMGQAGVSNDYRLVSKHYSVMGILKAGLGKIKSYNPKDRMKNIYLAYDSESFIAQNWGHVEIEHFDRVLEPDIIVVFGKNSQKYYKRHGYKTYLLPLGYDDYVHKVPPQKKRVYDISFCGTADKVRHSLFYPRFQACSVMANIGLEGKMPNVHFTNLIDYKDVPSFFSDTHIGFNDLVFPSPNMNCFEIPLGGTFMLVNDLIKEFPYPLKENRHYMVYKDYADLLIKTNLLLKEKDDLVKRGLAAQKEILKYPLSKCVFKMVDDLKLH